jgi:cbb3-type cytochrome oxidase subunit 3
MAVYEYISIYNSSVAVVTIAIVLIVFLAWQLRKRRRSK